MGTHLPLGVAEDDGLCDGEGVVKVTQSVKLPLFTLDRHEKLLDSFQSQLITEIKCHLVISIDLANVYLQNMQQEGLKSIGLSKHRGELIIMLKSDLKPIKEFYFETQKDKLQLRVNRMKNSPFDEDTDGVGHELARHFENLVRERSRNENDLSGGRQVAVDIVYLLLES